MKVYTLDIEHLVKTALIEDWLKLLPMSIASDVLAYKKEKDQLRVLGGKLLLKYALKSEKSELDLSQLKETDKGKLFFENSFFQFNISHSGNYVVLLTAQDISCGIDVEMHREVNINMFRRLFTDGEWEAIQGSEDPQALFFKCWAIKESVIKADGRGVEVISKTEIISNEEVVCDGKKWQFRMIDFQDGYSTAISFNKTIGEEVSAFPPRIIRIDPEILQKLQD